MRQVFSSDACEKLSRLHELITTIAQRTKRGLHDVWLPAVALLNSLYSNENSLSKDESNNQKTVKPVDGPMSIDYINHMLEARKVKKYPYPSDIDPVAMVLAKSYRNQGTKASLSHLSNEDVSFKTYLKQGKSIENVLRRIKSKLHARLIDNVIDFIRQNHKCFEHIPTATLVMGTNISDHIQLFYELNDQIHLEFNNVLVTLNEADCVSVGKILTTTKCALNK
ncbi:unnamed protein product, partial [Didymodactylos carnosus]